MELEEQYRVLRKQTKWAKLFFYQKTDVLYQLTFKFTKEYLMKHGDRTVPCHNFFIIITPPYSSVTYPY